MNDAIPFTSTTTVEISEKVEISENLLDCITSIGEFISNSHDQFNCQCLQEEMSKLIHQHETLISGGYE